MKQAEKYIKVRVRNKRTDQVRMIVKHVTEKTWFKKDWVVEDTNQNSQNLENAVVNDDLELLRKSVKAQGMKGALKASKQDIINWMNEPQPSEEEKKEADDLRKTIEDSDKAEKKEEEIKPKKRGRPKVKKK